ncbi:MAG TPA: protein kinase [Ignavibacteriaceae bacterium]|nr:protein kinase [Ignavibacteriaceae bacterium]
MNEFKGKTVSHYEVLDQVGQGGMGVVYKAKDQKLDRTVAIKFLPSHLASSEESKKRFMHEAKAAASLSHPNIMSIYEIDEYNDSVFMVMEFVEGQTLKSYIANLKSGSGIPFLKATEWMTIIAKGLKAAHDNQIVHRDIKSENIMLSDGDQLKIMDFGLAKLKNSSGLTKTGTSLGTLSYMSPEQAQGLNADHRSDIWSLGVVFYEMLTGETLFKAEHEAALLYLIVNEDPPAPSILDRKIPHQLDGVVKKMLIKDPDKRFQDLSELITALSLIKNDIEKSGNDTKKKAIAVLPFDNISSDKENEYFGDGLTEELIANLSRLKDMRVISRTTTMQYKGTKKDIQSIGRELGARYIMEGSVRKFQDDLRITAQLIDVESDEQLWAETYKGKLADVFDIQEKVSKQIVDALMVKLTPTEKIVLSKRSTLNPEAFDCNLRARDFLYRYNKNHLEFAIQLFQKALELDPRYSDAYAGLGQANATFYQLFERNVTLLDKAIEYSLKAIMYDPTLPEAYAALGYAYYNKEQFDEGIEAAKKAIELDTNNFLGYWILGRIYVAIDKAKDAISLFNKVIDLNPDFYTVYGDLQIAYGQLQDKESYNSILKQGLQIYEKYLSKHPDDARAHMFFAVDLVQIGDKEKAKIEAAKALELSPSDPLMQYNAACFYSQMNEKKLALQSLKKTIDSGFGEFEWLRRDSDLDNVRNEPEFIELLKGK